MHATGSEQVGGDWKGVLRLSDAHRGRLYAWRVRAQGVEWRVVADGHCGRETLASGTIAAGALTTVRVTGLPETIGAAILLLEARSTSSSTLVRAETSWIPIDCPCGG